MYYWWRLRRYLALHQGQERIPDSASTRDTGVILYSAVIEFYYCFKLYASNLHSLGGIVHGEDLRSPVGETDAAYRNRHTQRWTCSINVG